MGNPLRTIENASVPPTFNFARDVVDHWAARKPALPAVKALGHGEPMRVLTYDELAHRSAAVGAALRAEGIGKGSAVLVMLPRVAEWHIAMIACLRVGAVPVPCITMLTRQDVRYRCENVGALGVITTTSHHSKFADVPGLQARIALGESTEGWLDFRELEDGDARADAAEMSANDPAIVYYTSGSSGPPKGVVHAARALYLWRNSAIHWLGLGEGDSIWCTADTGWSKAGTSILFGPLSVGATSVVYDGPFDPDRRFELMQSLEVNVFCGPPTEYRRLVLCDPPSGLPHLRRAVAAGEALDEDTLRRWFEMTGVELLDGYGQTETLMTVTNRPGRPVKAGSMGVPLPGVRVAVLTDSGQTEAVNAVGELVVGGDSPQLMLGYYEDPIRSEACFTDLAGERWFLTGDRVSIDSDGDVFYLGRVDDVISSAGYRIGPHEVESALTSHPSVLEAAVVAGPDKERGEVVVAFVVLLPEASPGPDLVEELKAHVKSVTAPYKYPRHVVFVSELPKTYSGKLQRSALRRRLWENIDARSP